MRCLPALALLLALPGWAADPLKSPACSDALAALQDARTHDGAAAQQEARRAQATRACLGGSGTAGRPAPVAQAPIVVPPPVIDVPPGPQLPMPAPSLPPPVAIERPPVITACDAGGCWDSNGTRLNSAGPLLIGPAGACTTVGNVVRCP